MLNNETDGTQPQALEKATTEAPAKIENTTGKPADEDAALAAIYREAMAEDEPGEVDGDDAPGKGDNRKKVDRNPDGTFKGSNDAKPLKAEKTVSGPADPDAAKLAKEKAGADEKPKAEKPAKAEPVKGDEESEAKPKGNAHSPGHFRGWSQEKRAAFEKLPEYAQTFVLNHQSELLSTKTKGETELRTYAEKTAPLVKVFQENADYLGQMSRDLKMQPHEIVGNILKTEATLRTGTMDQKRQILQDMARDYGVKIALDDDQGGDNAAIHDLMQENARLKREAQAKAEREQAWQQQMLEVETAKTRSAIEAFRDATGDDGELLHPYFDEVRPQMARLMSTGKASTIEQAYEIATEPIRRAAEKARQEAARERERTAANDRARRAGRLNVNTATGEVQQYASEDEMLAATYRQVTGS